MELLSSKKALLLCLFSSSIIFTGLSQTPFTDVTVASGITDPIDPTLKRNHIATEYITGMNIGTGAAWVDYDKDGHLDLYFTNREAANLMYHNNGDGTFSEVAVALGIDDPTGDGSGVSFADYDNDGWDDLYLCNGYGDRLFRNINGASFSDVTSSAGFDINNEQRSTSASWGDYDNDGFLDLYISRHFAIYDAELSANSQDQLFHNNGDGTFTDVSGLFTTDQILGAGFIGGWFDFDKDGDPDIMLVNDCPLGDVAQPMRLFRNDGGNDAINDWTFTECSASVGINHCENGMGLAIGDYNRDGWMDIYYSNIGPARFFENNNGSFTDVTDDLGVGNQEDIKYSWGTAFIDHNNDGWQDLILVSGSLGNPDQPNYPSANYFYENNGDDTFSDISVAIEMGDSTRARSAVCGDYDNDGDLDVFIVNYHETVNLRQNNNDSGHHWVKISLDGTTSNKNGIGSKIKLSTPDGVTQYYETRSGSSLGGGDALYAHFGLKDNSSISEIEVTWPSGVIQTETNLNVDQVIVLAEPDGSLPVEFTHFSIMAQKAQALLSWTTANESNNKYFIVQRSSNGRDYTNIGQVAGQGNSSQMTNYHFTDARPNSGDNYYRLKQVDQDGMSKYSAIEYLYFNTQQTTITLSPNPVTNHYFDIQIGNDVNTQISLFDAFGKLVLSKNNIRTSTTITTEAIPSGIYFLKVQNQFENKTLKVLIN